MTAVTGQQRASAEVERGPVFLLEDVSVSYDSSQVLRNVTIDIRANQITAIIGPSGCGKSTLLRCLNRMNDLIAGAAVGGKLLFCGEDIAALDPVDLRRRVGMVFQRPNPFPKSVYDNVAFGPRLHSLPGSLDERVEQSLRRAALWDEVRDKLHKPATSLSGGQQQRLCIARALAVEPEVLLMDEPCSSLDPIATTKIEDLMAELRSQIAIVIVTHNMQQAARVADMTAFLTVEVDDAGHRTGTLIEFAPTKLIFTTPSDPRTEDYVTGRVG